MSKKKSLLDAAQSSNKKQKQGSGSPSKIRSILVWFNSLSVGMFVFYLFMQIFVFPSYKGADGLVWMPIIILMLLFVVVTSVLNVALIPFLNFKNNISKYEKIVWPVVFLLSLAPVIFIINYFIDLYIRSSL